MQATATGDAPSLTAISSTVLKAQLLNSSRAVVRERKRRKGALTAGSTTKGCALFLLTLPVHLLTLTRALTLQQPVAWHVPGGEQR
jgi:hypothetical protein